MSQYDAGPGDYSDREWEAPDWEQEPQATRQRLTLPPWALLAIVVAAVILLCVGLFFIVRAIREGSAAEEPTATATATRPVLPTATMTPRPPIATVALPTATIAPPTVEPTVAPLPPDTGGIEAGAKVVVQGTSPDGLNIRAQASTKSKILKNVKDKTTLEVLEGPEQAEGYVWWKVKAVRDPKIVGWAVGQYLKLK